MPRPESIRAGVDAVTLITDEYRQEICPPPKSVKVELTARCNFACAYCARSMKLRDQRDMDMDLFKKIATEIRDLGVDELGVFFLGESTMRNDLHEAIAYANNLGFRLVFLTTNGSLCTPEKAEQYMQAGLGGLKFSLNYADEEQFEQIARVKPKLFHKTLENLKAARQVRDRGNYDCGIYATYIRYDGEQAERMEALLDEVRPYTDEMYALPLYSQAALVVDQESEQGWRPVAGNRGRADNMREPLPCWSIFTEGHVSWDGKLVACCFSHDGRFDMGDLRTMSFMDSWNSPFAQELRRAHLTKDVSGTVCEDCVAYQ